MVPSNQMDKSYQAEKVIYIDRKKPEPDDIELGGTAPDGWLNQLKREWEYFDARAMDAPMDDAAYNEMMAEHERGMIERMRRQAAIARSQGQKNDRKA